MGLVNYLMVTLSPAMTLIKVTSIDFNKDNELFAVDGQQVKLYNYRSVVESPRATHL